MCGGKLTVDLVLRIIFDKTASTHLTSFYPASSKAPDASAEILLQIRGRAEQLNFEANKYDERQLDASIARRAGSIF
jgi:hypothetical protein